MVGGPFVILSQTIIGPWSDLWETLIYIVVLYIKYSTAIKSDSHSDRLHFAPFEKFLGLSESDFPHFSVSKFLLGL